MTAVDLAIKNLPKKDKEYRSYAFALRADVYVSMENMDDLSPDIEVLWGLYPDNTLEDDVKVAIIAMGFDDERLDQTSSKDIADAATEEAADTVSVDAEPIEENENIQATSENNLGRTLPLLERLKRKLETFMDETI